LGWRVSLSLPRIVGAAGLTENAPAGASEERTRPEEDAEILREAAREWGSKGGLWRREGELT